MIKRLLVLVLTGFVPVFVIGNPVEVIPVELRGALQPQVSVAPSGRIHLVFGKGQEVFHTSSDDGRQFSAPQKLGGLEKLALGMRRGPRVTATDHAVLVSAISHADGNLHTWFSADAGKTWKESIYLNSSAGSAREGLHSLTGDGRGLVAAVWLGLRQNGTEVWGRISHDGGATWEPDCMIYRSPDGHVCECCVPSAAISSTGKIGVMWRNWLGGSRDMYLSLSEDGRRFANPIKLGADSWQLNACPMDGGGLAISASNQWEAVWRRTRSVFASQTDAPETKLQDGATQPLISFLADTPVIVWEANNSLILKRGAASAAPFAKSASSASLANGKGFIAIAWEGQVDGSKTICFDQLR